MTIETCQKEKAKLEKQKRIVIEAYQKEKAIVEKQKAKAETKVKFWREMYIQE